MPLLPTALPRPGSSPAPAARTLALPNLPHFPSTGKPCKPQSGQPLGHHARPAPLVVVLHLLHGQLPLLRVGDHQPLDLLSLRENAAQPLLPPHPQTRGAQVAHVHPLRSNHTHRPPAFPQAHDATPPGHEHKPDGEAENDGGNDSNFCHRQPRQA